MASVLASYVLNYRNLLATKRERGRAVAMVPEYRRTGLISNHQNHKRRILKDVATVRGLRCRSMREQAMRMLDGISIDRIVLRDKPDEFKERYRRKLEMLRSLRLGGGVPPVFTDDPSRPYWRCPQSFYMPEGEWEIAKRHGVHFDEVHVLMWPGRAHIIAQRIETRLAHKGMWTYYILPEEEAEESEGRCVVRWAFEHPSDLVMFKFRYGCA